MQNLLSTSLLLLLVGVALAQAPAFDRASAAEALDFANWPQAGRVIEGCELPPTGMPGMDHVKAEAHDDFVEFEGELVSFRVRTVTEKDERGTVTGSLQLQVYVAPTEALAQEMLLAVAGETTSVQVGRAQAWNRTPFADNEPEQQRWLQLGTVRLGIRTSQGLQRIAFVYGNVLVRIFADGNLVERGLDVAEHCASCTASAEEATKETPRVLAVELASTDPVEHRSTRELKVTTHGTPTVLTYEVTGGMVTDEDAVPVYYAGDEGKHTIEARAMSHRGFPSRAILDVAVGK